MRDRREPWTVRLARNRFARTFFLGLATLAASLGFPIKVEPPPPRRPPATVVRDDPEDAEPGTADGAARTVR